MANELARIIVYGDIHLSSSGYGAHKDYPSESLSYFKKITETAEEKKATHIIGTGDLTFGRFDTLEYRTAVEDQLYRQNTITNGNRFELKGNHDSSTSGMTEYEFYVKKGLLKPSTNLSIGCVNLSMVDYGKVKKHKIIQPSNDTIDIVIAHDYLKFEDTQLPNFGKKFINLDNFSEWYGVNYILCGHIHKRIVFKGSIIKDNQSIQALVHYLGCMSRPSYIEGSMDEYGCIVLLTIYDDGNMKYDVIDIPLWSLEDSFNLSSIKNKKEKQEEKARKVDLTDLVQELNAHKRVIGDPEDKINAMDGINPDYKNKAIELLREANRN